MSVYQRYTVHNYTVHSVYYIAFCLLMVAVKTALVQFFIFRRCCFSLCAVRHLCVLLCAQFTMTYNV